MSNTEPGEPGTLTIQNATIRRGFTALPNAVMDLPNLSRDAKYLYAVLLRHAWRNGRCYPGYAVLQKEMGCGLRQIGQYLQELEGAFLLQRTRRGRGLTTVYVLLDAPDAGNGMSSSSETEGLDLPKRNAKEDSLEEDVVPNGTSASGKPTAPSISTDRWQVELFTAFADRLLPTPVMSKGEWGNVKLLRKTFTIPQMLDCWKAVADGQYGTEWDQRRLSFGHLIGNQFLANWVNRANGTYKQPTNGHAKRVYAGPSAVASYFEKRDGLNGHSTAPSGGGLGDDVVITRISGQLPR